MKDDLNKPLYADYRKQMTFGFDWSVPVTSGGKYYWLADMPFVIIGRILIAGLAFGAIALLNPFKYYSFVTAIISLIVYIIATSFYKYKFVYRFGRFRVMWEDKELHPETPASSRCDEAGKFLKTEENRKTARKSRFAFSGLFAAIIAFVLLYCFLWIGLSYLRVYSCHMGEIEEAKQIGQKYECVYWAWGNAGGETESGERISEQDSRKLWDIYHSLRWEYVSSMWVFNNLGLIEIGINTPFGYGKLVWYEDIRDATQAKDHFVADTAVQLDEHWFYVRMDDGRGF